MLFYYRKLFLFAKIVIIGIIKFVKEVIGEIGSENELVVEGQGNLDSALTSVSEENSGEAVKENESNTQTEEEQQENRSDVQAEEQQESESNIQSEEQQENGANVQAEEQ